jgi:hypothetical protein
MASRPSSPLKLASYLSSIVDAVLTTFVLPGTAHQHDRFSVTSHEEKEA